MIVGRSIRYVYIGVSTQNKPGTDSTIQFYNSILIPLFGLQPPNIRSKNVAGSNHLLDLLTFNIAYDFRIYPSERHQINSPECYLALAYTGYRPAEVVDAEKKKPSDGSWDELFDAGAILSLLNPKLDDGPPDEHSKVLEKLLSHEIFGRGRPKALYYEEISLMVACHPETGEDVLAMSVKFIHHKGADNKPNP